MVVGDEVSAGELWSGVMVGIEVLGGAVVADRVGGGMLVGIVEAGSVFGSSGAAGMLADDTWAGADCRLVEEEGVDVVAAGGGGSGPSPAAYELPCGREIPKKKIMLQHNNNIFYDT